MKTLPTIAISLILLAAAPGCDLLPIVPECLDQLCPLPALSDYETEELVGELADRGVDEALDWVFGED